MINHRNINEIVPANSVFADYLQEIAMKLMSAGTVRSSQDDVGAPERRETLDTALIFSWTRASNRIMRESVEVMKPVETMSLNQVLRAGIREDSVVRLCQAYLVAGLVGTALRPPDTDHMPLIVDLIPCYYRKKGSSSKDDFKIEYGRIDIKDCWELSSCVITYILDSYKKIFVDGQESLDAILRVIKQAKHIVLELTDTHINTIDPEYDSNRMRTGGTSVCHAFIIKHAVTGSIIVIYSSFQVSTTIGGVSEV